MSIAYMSGAKAEAGDRVMNKTDGFLPHGGHLSQMSLWAGCEMTFNTPSCR